MIVVSTGAMGPGTLEDSGFCSWRQRRGGGGALPRKQLRFIR